MDSTTLGLKKPLTSEAYDIQIFNDNADKTNELILADREQINNLNAEVTYLGESEPSSFNQSTLWFEVEGEVNLSGDGVSIGNAETSNIPPESNFWFEPVI